jgi:uncharacterized repeat protein (TIGR01451 family)
MLKRRRTFVTLTGVLLLGWLLALAGASPASAVTVPLTVTITSVDAVGDDMDGIGRSDADFYAGVTFERGTAQERRTDGPSFDTHQDDEAHITPFWPIGENVTSFTVNSVPTSRITLAIWDHDECSSPFCTDTGVFESDDDQLDISPGGGETVDLDIDMRNGRWSGDLAWPQSCVTGDSGEAAKVCFDISVDGTNGDADGDFMLDGWETNGFNADGNNSIDVDLPLMGAHPGRKDLFLELDCIVDSTVATGHTHCPVNAAVQTVVQSFADAPVNNIDGTQGIQLHVDIGGVNGAALNADVKVPRVAAPGNSVTGTYGNYGGGGTQINEAGNTILDYDGAAGNAGTNFFTLKNMNANRDYIFRYGIFGHQTNSRAAVNDCTSGQAKGIPGVNFYVTLGGLRGSTGNPCWGVDANNFSTGSQNQQAGTLMHEFGHTLGLGHGGVDGFNNKPNYLSVMNYGISTGPASTPNSVQFCGVPAVGGLPGGCDYSRNLLTTLNEVNPPGLDECVGIGLGLGSVDWDGGGITGASCSPASANVSANVNGDYNDANNDGDQDPGEANTLSALPGAEDWNRIFYGFRTLDNFQTAGTPVADEPDPASIEAARAHIASLVRPTLGLDKTGPSDAVPGDTLTYGLKATNTGRGPALVTEITDTKPDATTAGFTIGTLVVGGAATRSLTYSVPCTTTDGTVLTNSASATATDLIANPFTASDSVTTTVHAPVLTLAKTATATVNAGEAITYRLTYENTGSGAASDVTVTDTLPVGVYYSKALDTGAGPQPTTVTNNASGTTTLTWTVGAVAGASGPQVVEYTARPGLLFIGGDSVRNSASLTFTNANGCTYTPVTAAKTTGIIVVTATRNPLSQGFWKTHPELRTAERLARIQATDQRFDGADGSTPNGQLSQAEVQFVLSAGGTQADSLRAQLMATYLNLADRRINAATAVASKTANTRGVGTVRDAALFAMSTLGLPLNSSTTARYSDAINILEEINQNKSERY